MTKVPHAQCQAHEPGMRAAAEEEDAEDAEMSADAEVRASTPAPIQSIPRQAHMMHLA